MTRQNLPGTSAEELFQWPVTELGESETTFAVQEHIQDMVRSHPLDIDRIVGLPADQDQHVWIYEQLRQIMVELNQLVIALGPVCTDKTCPKMTASKWEFLCATHKTPQECSAIDYLMHTLKAFSSLLNKKELFPSRVRVPSKSMSQLKTVPRRLIRVFAHAFYQHRDVFDTFEARSALCGRFVHLVQTFELLPRDQIIIPLSTLNL